MRLIKLLIFDEKCGSVVFNVSSMLPCTCHEARLLLSSQRELLYKRRYFQTASVSFLRKKVPFKGSFVHKLGPTNNIYVFQILAPITFLISPMGQCKVICFSKNGVFKGMLYFYHKICPTKGIFVPQRVYFGIKMVPSKGMFFAKNGLAEGKFVSLQS